MQRCTRTRASTQTAYTYTGTSNVALDFTFAIDICKKHQVLGSQSHFAPVRNSMRIQREIWSETKQIETLSVYAE